MASDIIVTGAGSSSSNLTIPGQPQYNNTDVMCQAANGTQFFHQKSTLKIQGMQSSNMQD